MCLVFGGKEEGGGRERERRERRKVAVCQERELDS